ncbi:MAG TPA: hypothetical protein VJ997_01765 [Longimicrobiales bacterium]|nr:hypothetical protein [Longimicrobiales bacterium]
MIVKRYGTTVQSVDPNFESTALNEVGFRRDKEWTLPVEEFDAGYVQLTVHELSAEAEGPVQDHTEQLLLDRLEGRLLELEAGAESGCVLMVENGDGPDYPKTRQRTHNVIVEGENKLHFVYTIAPTLRIGVYRKKA